jgi:putative redox protein
MTTAKIEYLGSLRTKITHVKSGTSMTTDAPVDNQGKGEFISPTDMVAAALGACMQTIIGIYCQERDIPFHHCTIEITKIMASAPRRISELDVHIDLRNNNFNEKQIKGVIAAAEACPVAKSIHPDIVVKFHYVA